MFATEDCTFDIVWGNPINTLGQCNCFRVFFLTKEEGKKDDTE